MRYRSLDDSGLIVSVTRLGCNNFGRRLDLDATRPVVDAALEAGVTLLDTADSYGNGGGSEEILGEVLAGRRDQVFLATKFGHQGFDMGYGPAAGGKGGRAKRRPRSPSLSPAAVHRARNGRHCASTTTRLTNQTPCGSRLS
jgi:aryl-alcohol dehydrogenase-like predicted oxidoreductase